MPRDVIATVGIRYAEPVDGRRRFAAPVPIADLERVGDGFGPAAWQSPQPGWELGDDCLTLNVWAPADAEGAPVLLWVHGGGYVGGSALQHEFDGGPLAADRGLVVVTMQYRLGAWGFLDLRTAVDDAVANAGLLDVLAALDWLRAHVADFGGDPARITPYGLSAGAGIVGALLASRPARGRMAGAIMHSAPLTKVRQEHDSAADTARFLELLAADPALAEPTALLAAQDALLLDVAVRRPGALACSPVIDGTVLADRPDDVLEAGDGEPIPVLGAWNTDEATAFRDGPVIRTDAAALESEAGLTAAGLRERWPGWPDDPSRMRQATAAWFADPLRRALLGQARHTPAWLLRFDHRTAALDAAGLGATHSADAGFVMGDAEGPLWDLIAPDGPTPADLRVRERMRDAWTAFATSGDPGWPALSAADPREFVMR